jgi:hypothetical protein
LKAWGGFELGRIFEGLLKTWGGFGDWGREGILKMFLIKHVYGFVSRYI